MASIGDIAVFIKRLFFIIIFIIFIPGFFFQLPKNGSQLAVAAVHGLLYSLVYTLLDVIFSIKRIIMCIKTGGAGSA